ncbi:MAG TPA: BsuPI-related putative proteinase inhibitor [Euzebyales bacterium]
MSRLVAVALIALAVAACGDASPPLAETSTDRLRLELRVDPDPLVSGAPATFELLVTNVSDERALLEFDTTQRGDVLFATNEVDVYRWAERRAFAQQTERVPLAPGQTVLFELDEAPLPVGPGQYEVLASVTGLPKLQTVRASLSVTGDEATPSGPASEGPQASRPPSERPTSPSEG